MLLVEPDLHHPLVVPGDEVPLHLLPEPAGVVRHESSIDVTHSAAGTPDHLTSTHPDLRGGGYTDLQPPTTSNLEGELVLLPAPDQEAGVVTSEAEEVLSVHRDQAASVYRRGVGSGEELL